MRVRRLQHLQMNIGALVPGESDVAYFARLLGLHRRFHSTARGEHAIRILHPNDLVKLQTDRIDLLQFHEIIRMEDPDRVFAAGGGMEAAVEAQKAGKIRYIGFTGHKSPDIHLKMLETADAHKFHFDSVQMPLNVMDAHYNSFGKKVLPVLVKKEIGVLGMKPMGAGIILRSKTVEPVECLHYAMSLPTSVVITGCDSVTLVEQAVSAAERVQPLSETQVATLLAKTKAAAQNGEFEGYKMTKDFDGTTHNPQWLG